MGQVANADPCITFMLLGEPGSEKEKFCRAILSAFALSSGSYEHRSNRFPVLDDYMDLKLPKQCGGGIEHVNARFIHPAYRPEGRSKPYKRSVVREFGELYCRLANPERSAIEVIYLHEVNGKLKKSHLEPLEELLKKFRIPKFEVIHIVTTGWSDKTGADKMLAAHNDQDMKRDTSLDKLLRKLAHKSRFDRFDSSSKSVKNIIEQNILDLPPKEDRLYFQAEAELYALRARKSKFNKVRRLKRGGDMAIVAGAIAGCTALTVVTHGAAAGSFAGVGAAVAWATFNAKQDHDKMEDLRQRVAVASAKLTEASKLKNDD